ncbi:phosphoribosyltransferase family protein [Pseudofrankia sp. DC12]|uniref:phosphoribosyltransferase n=1 Tax=Pseudofrankia sp. DC12 TaxID=683315 RepID=UPI0005F82823|nr:phosphoribosyltransferase family protein [Pseudofrankia sp. DC12]
MTARVFEHSRLWRLTAPALDRAVQLLATAATENFGAFTQVVGIADGGTVPATQIATQLGVRPTMVRARHNPTDAHYSPATGQVWCDPGDLAPAGRVLVVDDICGSGATLRTVVAALAERAPTGTQLVTATLCLNAGSTAPPDLWVWADLRDWVVFPWETQPPADTMTDLPLPTQAYRR